MADKKPARDRGLSAHARLVLKSLQPYTAELDERLSVLDERLSVLSQQLAELRAHADRIDRDAQNRIDEVVQHLADTTAAVRRIEASWSSPMYMTDPSAFRLSPSEGGGFGFRRAIGEAPADDDAFYRAFEDVFRGPTEHVKALQGDYVSMFPKNGLIVDIGCGRGEFLSLLSEAGRERLGVDANPDMAAVAASAGECEVLVTDGAAWLEEQEEGSVAGVFAAQVIEHMTAGSLERFLRAAFRALDPEHGVLIAETVNPYFIPAFRMFHVDLTHELLIYPEVVLSMAKAIGFDEGDIHFPGGNGDPLHDRSEVGAYALIARRRKQHPHSA